MSKKDRFTTRTAAPFPNRWRRTAVLVVIAAVCCGFPFDAGAETIRDNFDSRTYAGNDGTQPWATNWLEIGENDGPGSGEIRIQNDQGVRWVLRIQNNRGIQREADLSAATSAILRFDYRRNDLDTVFDYVIVGISGDGGATWSELDRISGPTNDGSYQPASYDISSYAAANTRIRLQGSTFLGGTDEVYFDSIEIETTVAPTAPVVAYYALDGGATDSSGNGHDGGSQGSVAYQRAKVCDGIQLDGSGYLLVPDSNAFDLADGLTVMAWIHPDSLSIPGHDNLYSFLSKDTNSEFHVRSNGALYWWWGNGSLTTGAGTIPVGTWSHVAFVYSRSAGRIVILVNGSPVLNQAYSSPLPVNTDPFYIGTDKATGGGEIPGRRFYGSIDEVRIYGDALTAAEIAALMNTSDPCELPTPLAEWRFDECEYPGTAPLAADAQGSHDLRAQGEVESEPAGVVGRAAMADRSTDSFLTDVNVPMTGDWTVSTWFRMPFTHTEGSRYHVLGAMAGGGNDLLWLDRNRNYRWGAWANSTVRSGSFRFGTLANGWHHLVAVGHSGRTDLYIDGVWRDSVSLQPAGNLHYVGTSYDQSGGQQGFRADLDEFLVFEGTLSPVQIQRLRQLQSTGRNLDGMQRAEVMCGAVIDHYEIVHDGSALTCAPEAVTVRACLDAGCTQLYTDDVTIDLSPSGWVGGDSRTLSGGSGVFRLHRTTPGTVSLAVSSLDPAADQAPHCVDGGGGSSCDLTFYEAGFLFDVADLTACSPADNIRIAAVRADATGEQCIGDDSFANTTRNVNFWSGYQEPNTGTRSVVVNGTAVAGTSPGTAIPLSFDAQAESRLSVQYNDAGRMGLSARFAGSGDEAGLVMVGSDSFVATPHHLQVEATTNGATPLDNTTSAGDPHWPAGEGFTVAVSGVCADDSLTPNFAATTGFNATAADPAPGTFSGGPLAAADYAGGTATASAAYSEVGTVTLQAAATDYLGSGIDVIGSTVVGRFTPFRFDVALNSPQFDPACAAGGFTYIGQSFAYTTAPVITVTARNKDGGTTANYSQAWWKITGTTVTGKVYDSASGTLDLAAIPAGDPAISDLGGGIGLLTFSDGGGIRFVRGATPTAPFDAEISLAINVLDADGIAATANPVTFGAASAGNGISFTGGGKAMHWGRLALYNAYGSERVPLAMPLRAESFDGTTFITHALDSCTGTPLSRIHLSNDSGTVTADNPIAVGSGSSSAGLSNPFVAGDAGLQFTAPGAEGFIQVQVDLSSHAWLRYDWNGDGVADDPSARATFGIYKGRPSLIYLRETFR